MAVVWLHAPCFLLTYLLFSACPLGLGGYFCGGCVAPRPLLLLQCLLGLGVTLVAVVWHRAPCFCFNHWSWLGLHWSWLAIVLGLLAVVLYCAPCFFVDVYGTAPPASLCILFEREALWKKSRDRVHFLDTPAVPVENELNTNVLSENCKV
ncbi:hypothetical protein DFH29DRAFT_881676 [Suillus ampliporus]|nr:hypothetical protein DFH29DRAFT_881676 [Suillus ampliporus]